MAPSPDPGSTSSVWLAQLRQGQPDAWQRLVRVYGPLVYAWCRQSHLQPSDAADVAQEVYRSLAGALAAFDHTGRFRAWLSAITRSKLVDHFRRRAEQPPAVGGSTAQGAFLALAEVVPAEPDEAGNTTRLVRRALERIRPDFTETTWLAFTRCVLDGAGTAEVAAELGLTADAVRQARSRVLRRLRQELDDLFP